MLKSALIYAVARGGPGLIALLALYAFTRLLSVEEYGRYSVALAVVGLANVTIYQWLRFYLGRFVHRREGKARDVFLGRVNLVFSCIGLGIAVCALGLLFFVPAEWRGIAALSGGALVALAWFDLNRTLANALLLPWLYARMLLLRASAALGVGISAALLGFGALSPLIGLIVGILLSIAVFGRRLMLGAPMRRAGAADLREGLAYGLPLSAAAGLAWVIASSDRLIIAGLLGAAETGLYAPTYDLASQTLTLALVVINSAGYPLVMRAAEAGDPSALTRQLRQNGQAVFALGASGAAFFWLFADEIAQLFFGGAFDRTAAELLPLIGLAAALAGFKSFYLDLGYQVSRATRWQIVPVACACVVNVALNFALIPFYGLQGAAIATVAAYALAAAMSFAWSARRFAEMPRIGGVIGPAAATALAFAGGAGAVSGGLPLEGPLLAVAGLAAGAASGLTVAVLVDLADIRRALVTFIRARR